MKQPLIWVNNIGLEDKKAFVAHERGGWGPENKGSDCLEHPLELYGAVDLICYANFLERSEEFKIVVFVKDDVEARKIFAKRILEDVHITIDFDYNADYKTFWLLDSSYPFIHPEGRSSRNVFLH